MRGFHLDLGRESNSEMQSGTILLSLKAGSNHFKRLVLPIMQASKTPERQLHRSSPDNSATLRLNVGWFFKSAVDSLATISGILFQTDRTSHSSLLLLPCLS